MNKYKYIILGAGPSGLSLALKLLEMGYSLDEILILEKNDSAGGLCRSVIVDGHPLDIGGGHFLDVRSEEVLNFLFQFLGEVNWRKYDRIAKINIHDQYIDHPLEGNIYQLPPALQVEYLESIGRSGSFLGEILPTDFHEYIYWKLGSKIAEEYMIPYNNKIWSMDLSELGTYWLEKLPNVSFRDSLLSVINKSPEGSLSAHGSFYYPVSGGYGSVWDIMSEYLKGSIKYNCQVESINFESMIVNGEWVADTIITTIPWTSLLDRCDIDESIKTNIRNLKYSSIDIEYIPETIKSNAHWIYEPSENINHHRKLIRSNFIDGASGYWTETNSKRNKGRFFNNFFHTNEYAYPINTINKPDVIKKILSWAESKNVYGLGRWGEWQHMNSDVAVLGALRMAEKLQKKDKK